MKAYIKMSQQWTITWLVIWVVVYLAALFAYPSDPSIWFGWLPSSVVITFGLMVVTFFLGYIFCKQRFKLQ
jgi:hypothetical protein